MISLPIQSLLVVSSSIVYSSIFQLSLPVVSSSRSIFRSLHVYPFQLDVPCGCLFQYCLFRSTVFSSIVSSGCLFQYCLFRYRLFCSIVSSSMVSSGRPLQSSLSVSSLPVVSSSIVSSSIISSAVPSLPVSSGRLFQYRLFWLSLPVSSCISLPAGCLFQYRLFRLSLLVQFCRLFQYLSVSSCLSLPVSSSIDFQSRLFQYCLLVGRLFWSPPVSSSLVFWSAGCLFQDCVCCLLACDIMIALYFWSAILAGLLVEGGAGTSIVYLLLVLLPKE